MEERWICPNDETVNTGELCLICGMTRQEARVKTPEVVFKPVPPKKPEVVFKPVPPKKPEEVFRPTPPKKPEEVFRPTPPKKPGAEAVPAAHEKPVPVYMPEKSSGGTGVRKKGAFAGIAVAAVAAVILAGIVLLTGKEKIWPTAFGRQESESTAVTAQVTAPPATQPVELSGLLTRDDRVSLAKRSGGGLALDAEGNVWFWQDSSGTAWPTGITGGASFAEEYGGLGSTPLLNRDGSITFLHMVYDYDTETLNFAGEILTCTPGIPVRKMVSFSDQLFLISEDGGLYSFDPDLNRLKKLDIPGHVTELSCTDVDEVDMTGGSETVYKCGYSAVCTDGSVYFWEVDLSTGAWTDPELSGLRARDVLQFMNYGHPDIWGALTTVVLDPEGVLRLYDYNGSMICEAVFRQGEGSLYGIGRSACYYVSGDTLVCFGNYSSGVTLPSTIGDCDTVFHSVLEEYSVRLPGQILEFVPDGWSNAVILDDGCLYIWGQSYGFRQIFREDGTPFLPGQAS